MFSDECHFHLSGHVNRQNMRFWGTTNPHDTVDAPKSREKVTVWAGIGDFGLIGSYFFEDDSGSAETVKTENYLKMMRTWFIPQLKRKSIFKDVVFQQDGAPPHCSKEAIEWLTSQFTSDRLISRNSSFKWPPYSPDLNPCDYFLWGYLKSKVYSPYPSTTEELKKNIRREFKKISKETIGKVVENFAARAQLVISKKGGRIEHIFNN